MGLLLWLPSAAPLGSLLFSLLQDHPTLPTGSKFRGSGFQALIGPHCQDALQPWEPQFLYEFGLTLSLKFLENRR